MTYEVVHVLLIEPSSIAGDSSAIFEPCTDSCGCNACNELVCSRRDAEGAENEFEYNYDDIGNRIASFDLGTNRTYTANDFNQCLEISTHADGAL